jgi:hypothetical protein
MAASTSTLHLGFDPGAWNTVQEAIAGGTGLSDYGEGGFDPAAYTVEPAPWHSQRGNSARVSERRFRRVFTHVRVTGGGGWYAFYGVSPTDFLEAESECATQELLGDPEAMAGITRGESDVKEGRTVPWRAIRRG